MARRPRSVVLVAWLALSTACAFGRQTVEIGSVAISDDGRTLNFGTGTCGQNPTATVDETPTTVTIHVTADREPIWGGGCGADEWASVSLEEPLAGREVFDAATGEPVRAESTELP
jgi:hypothetical protein